MRRMFALALAAAALLAAQGLDSQSGWQFYRELSTGPETGPATLTLNAEILANIRVDAGDLRIVDAAGNPVPYDLRILLGERSVESYEAAELSRSTEGDSAESTLDLGENPVEHNLVQVDTEGTSFRRQVAVFGSDDAEQWTPLTENGMILRAMANGGAASINRVPYMPSEQRYLRVTVARDQQADPEAPVIEALQVQRANVIRGEEEEAPAQLAPRESIVGGQFSVSRYTIDLPGRIPLHALRFKTAAGPFTRNYQLMSLLGDNIAPVPISVGRMRRNDGDASDGILLRFQETFARQLQLTIADDADEPPLDISEPTVLFASRQLVVDFSETLAEPLRLYYGNPAAPAPDQGLRTERPYTLDESVPLLELGPQLLNAAYVAPPAPLYERMPWLIYILTAAASLALLAILRSLVFDVGA